MRIFLILGLIIMRAEAFEVKRSKVILHSFDDYRICHEKDFSGSWCHEALKVWVKDHTEDAFKAAKATRLYMNNWLAVPFFANAMSLEDFNCKDPDLKLAVIGALNLSKTGNEKVISEAETIAFEKCKKELLPSVTDSAVIDSNTFANICKKLDLTGIRKQRCDSLDL